MSGLYGRLRNIIGNDTSHCSASLTGPTSRYGCLTDMPDPPCFTAIPCVPDLSLRAANDVAFSHAVLAAARLVVDVGIVDTDVASRCVSHLLSFFNSTLWEPLVRITFYELDELAN